jgi:hypothetical protein
MKDRVEPNKRNKILGLKARHVIAWAGASLGAEAQVNVTHKHCKA